MITEKEYLESVKIINQYKKENKKKLGRKEKKFTLDNKKILVDIIFLKTETYNYNLLIDKISSKFKIGQNNSKKMLIELQLDGIIIKSSNRGLYSNNLNK